MFSKIPSGFRKTPQKFQSTTSLDTKTLPGSISGNVKGKAKADSNPNPNLPLSSKSSARTSIASMPYGTPGSSKNVNMSASNLPDLDLDKDLPPLPNELGKQNKSAKSSDNSTKKKSKLTGSEKQNESNSGVSKFINLKTNLFGKNKKEYQTQLKAASTPDLKKMNSDESLFNYKEIEKKNSIYRTGDKHTASESQLDKTGGEESPFEKSQGKGKKSIYQTDGNNIRSESELSALINTDSVPSYYVQRLKSYSNSQLIYSGHTSASTAESSQQKVNQKPVFNYRKNLDNEVKRFEKTKDSWQQPLHFDYSKDLEASTHAVLRGGIPLVPNKSKPTRQQIESLQQAILGGEKPLVPAKSRPTPEQIQGLPGRLPRIEITKTPEPSEEKVPQQESGYLQVPNLQRKGSDSSATSSGSGSSSLKGALQTGTMKIRDTEKDLPEKVGNDGTLIKGIGLSDKRRYQSAQEAQEAAQYIKDNPATSALNRLIRHANEAIGDKEEYAKRLKDVKDFKNKPYNRLHLKLEKEQRDKLEKERQRRIAENNPDHKSNFFTKNLNKLLRRSDDSSVNATASSSEQIPPSPIDPDEIRLSTDGL